MIVSRTTPTLTENFSSRGENVRKIISNVLTSIQVATSPSPSAKMCPHLAREPNPSSTPNLMTRIRQRHSESSVKTREGDESNSVSNVSQPELNRSHSEDATSTPLPDPIPTRLRRASFIYGEYAASREESPLDIQDLLPEPHAIEKDFQKELERELDREYDILTGQYMDKLPPILNRRSRDCSAYSSFNTTNASSSNTTNASSSNSSSSSPSALNTPLMTLSLAPSPLISPNTTPNMTPNMTPSVSSACMSMRASRSGSASPSVSPSVRSLSCSPGPLSKYSSCNSICSIGGSSIAGSIGGSSNSSFSLSRVASGMLLMGDLPELSSPSDLKGLGFALPSKPLTPYSSIPPSDLPRLPGLLKELLVPGTSMAPMTSSSVTSSMVPGGSSSPGTGMVPRTVSSPATSSRSVTPMSPGTSSMVPTTGMVPGTSMVPVSTLVHMPASRRNSLTPPPTSRRNSLTPLMEVPSPNKMMTEMNRRNSVKGLKVMKEGVKEDMEMDSMKGGGNKLDFKVLK